MKKIFKYPLTPGNISSIEMPKNGKILCCKLQHGRPCLWVVTDCPAEMKTRHFTSFMTGEQLPDGIDMEYVETILMNAGDYVIHIFEIKR